MKKQKILILILIICAVGIVSGSIFWGLSKASKGSSALYEQFMNEENGKFQYMNIEWNSSVDIVQKNLQDIHHNMFYITHICYILIVLYNLFCHFSIFRLFLLLF